MTFLIGLALMWLGYKVGKNDPKFSGAKKGTSRTRTVSKKGQSVKFSEDVIGWFMGKKHDK